MKMSSILSLLPFSVSGSDLEITAASQQQIDHIKAGLDAGLTITKPAAIKSTRHKNAYYVGAKFTGPGIESGVVGVWLISGEPTAPGMILGVDGAATTFSPFPKASKTKAKASVTDKECRAIHRHLDLETD